MSCKRLQAVTIVDIATEWLIVVDAHQHFHVAWVTMSGEWPLIAFV